MADSRETAASTTQASTRVATLRVSAERLWPFVPVGVGLLSFLLGITKLTKYPWWHDEMVTARVSSGSFTEIWRAARGTEQPHLLFYVLMKGWFDVIGGVHHHWLARFPSVVWMALAVAILTALGTRLFGRVAGLVGGLVLATNFLFLHWEQFARDLTISLCFATFATYAFVRMIESPSSARWAWIWAASVLAAGWIELFGICILAGHAAAYFVLTRRRGLVRPERRRELWLGLASFALTVPNMVLVATGDNGQLNWIPPVSVKRLVNQPWVWAGRDPVVLVGCVLGVAVLLAASVHVSARVKMALAPGWRVESWKMALMVGWLVAPFVVTLVLSAIKPAYESHYLFSSTPALSLIVGVAVAHLPRRLAVPLLVGTIVAAALMVADFEALPPYAPFSALF